MDQPVRNSNPIMGNQVALEAYTRRNNAERS